MIPLSCPTEMSTKSQVLCSFKNRLCDLVARHVKLKAVCYVHDLLARYGSIFYVGTWSY